MFWLTVQNPQNDEFNVRQSKAAEKPVGNFCLKSVFLVFNLLSVNYNLLQMDSDGGQCFVFLSLNTSVSQFWPKKKKKKMFGSCVQLKIWNNFCTSGFKRLKVWLNTDQREKCNSAWHQMEQLCFNNVSETVCSRAVSNNEAKQHVACRKIRREMACLLDWCANEAWLIHLCSVRFGGNRSNKWLLPNRVQLQQILSLQSLPLLRASCPNTDTGWRMVKQ